MIEPFTILQTRVEPDGSVGVLYSVKIREVRQKYPAIFVTKTLESYFSHSAQQDTRAALYEHLKQAGWIT